jgi:hypothetical protein
LNAGGTGEESRYINVYVYIYIMSRLINVSDAIYEELTLLKRAKGISYSGAIDGLIRVNGTGKKSHNLKEMIAWAEERARGYAGKKEKTDHDLILYGVSRDGD